MDVIVEDVRTGFEERGDSSVIIPDFMEYIDVDGAIDLNIL